MLRLEGASAWADMTPAFAYHGNKLTWTMLADGREMKYEPQIEERDQFALEMDHFSDCILQNRQPHPPGEEGWQDQRIMEWIYEGVDL